MPSAERLQPQRSNARTLVAYPEREKSGLAHLALLVRCVGQSDPSGLATTGRSRNVHCRIETRIASYEMAYRMQTAVPELMDI